MNQSKIKALLIILTTILIVVVLGVLYSVSMKNKKEKALPAQAPGNSQVPETEITKEVLDSLTAPTGEKPTPPSRDVVNSLAAPAPAKKGQNKTEPAPVPDDVLKSLNAPAK